jgi:hypothetical protein
MPFEILQAISYLHKAIYLKSVLNYVPIYFSVFQVVSSHEVPWIKLSVQAMHDSDILRNERKYDVLRS